MKRLKNKLLSMEKDTVTYHAVYNGSMTVVDSHGIMYSEENSVYYSGNVGFDITATHKLAQDKPTVTIIIPCDAIGINNELDLTKELIYMKRLKKILLSMMENTSTYKEMYEGEMEMIFPSTAWDGHTLPPEIHKNPEYWSGENSFEITVTNKLAQDKPTVTCHLPAEKLGIDPDLLSDSYKKTAADFCLREFKKYIDAMNAELYNRGRPDDETGKYYLPSPGGEVLVRNSVYFAVCAQRDYEYGSGSTVYLLPDDKLPPPKMCLCIRMQVQLPKRKLRKVVQMLCRDLPDAVEQFTAEFDICRFNSALALAEKQAAIRTWLKNSGYCAFVANGSILPRAKGTDLPMKAAVPFQSTPDDEIEICGVRGMGIKKGVTVITGGGYSGKSTLLDAISAGIYDHISGDGRELCITDESALSISAEDGRSVKHVNISPFIKWLPGGDTADFSTEHASGSTSQAANIMEAVDIGAKLLLIDEDRSATNFMIRDQMMKELIEKEPITPFTDRVNELYSSCGVSTILVIGGSGEYLSVADKIYMMEDYLIHDVTEKSKRICESHGICESHDTVIPDKLENPNYPNYSSGTVCVSGITAASWGQSRTLYSDGFSSYPEDSGSERLEISDMGFIIIGDEKIDIRGLHNIVSTAQLDSMGFMLRYLEITNKDIKIDIRRRVDELYEKIENEGLDFLYSSYFTTCERFMDLPRKHELFQLISRMRKINYIYDKQ